MELLEDKFMGSKLHGRWWFSKSDLDNAIVPDNFMPSGEGPGARCGTVPTAVQTCSN